MRYCFVAIDWFSGHPEVLAVGCGAEGRKRCEQAIVKRKADSDGDCCCELDTSHYCIVDGTVKPREAVNE